MEQPGREARKKNAATNGGMAAWKATLRWHGAWRAGVDRFVSTTVHRLAGNGRGGGKSMRAGVRGRSVFKEDMRGVYNRAVFIAPGSGRYRGTAHEDGAVR